MEIGSGPADVAARGMDPVPEAVGGRGHTHDPVHDAAPPAVSAVSAPTVPAHNDVVDASIPTTSRARSWSGFSLGSGLGSGLVAGWGMSGDVEVEITLEGGAADAAAPDKSGSEPSGDTAASSLSSMSRPRLDGVLAALVSQPSIAELMAGDAAGIMARGQGSERDRTLSLDLAGHSFLSAAMGAPGPDEHGGRVVIRVRKNTAGEPRGEAAADATTVDDSYEAEVRRALAQALSGGDGTGEDADDADAPPAQTDASQHRFTLDSDPSTASHATASDTLAADAAESASGVKRRRGSSGGGSAHASAATGPGFGSSKSDRKIPRMEQVTTPGASATLGGLGGQHALASALRGAVRRPLTGSTLEAASSRTRQPRHSLDWHEAVAALASGSGPTSGIGLLEPHSTPRLDAFPDVDSHSTFRNFDLGRARLNSLAQPSTDALGAPPSFDLPTWPLPAPPAGVVGAPVLKLTSSGSWTIAYAPPSSLSAAGSSTGSFPVSVDPAVQAVLQPLPMYQDAAAFWRQSGRSLVPEDVWNGFRDADAAIPVDINCYAPMTDDHVSASSSSTAQRQSYVLGSQEGACPVLRTVFLERLAGDAPLASSAIAASAGNAVDVAGVRRERRECARRRCAAVHAAIQATLPSVSIFQIPHAKDGGSAVPSKGAMLPLDNLPLQPGRENGNPIAFVSARSVVSTSPEPVSMARALAAAVRQHDALAAGRAVGNVDDDADAPVHLPPQFLLVPAEQDGMPAVRLVRVLSSETAVPRASAPPAAPFVPTVTALPSDAAQLPFAYAFVQQFVQLNAENAAAAGIAAPPGALPTIPVDVLPAGRTSNWDVRSSGTGCFLSQEDRMMKVARWLAKKHRAEAQRRAALELAVAALDRGADAYDDDVEGEGAAVSASGVQRATADADAAASIARRWQHAAEAALIEAFAADGVNVVHAMKLSADHAIQYALKLLDTLRTSRTDDEQAMIKAQHALSLLRKWAAVAQSPATVTTIDTEQMLQAMQATSSRGKPGRGSRVAGGVRRGAAAAGGVAASLGVDDTRGDMRRTIAVASGIPERLVTADGRIRVNGRFVSRFLAEELAALSIPLSAPARIAEYAAIRKGHLTDETAAAEDLSLVADRILPFAQENVRVAGAVRRGKDKRGGAADVSREWVLERLRHAAAITQSLSQRRSDVPPFDEAAGLDSAELPDASPVETDTENEPSASHSQRRRRAAAKRPRPAATSAYQDEAAEIKPAASKRSASRRNARGRQQAVEEPDAGGESDDVWLNAGSRVLPDGMQFRHTRDAQLDDGTQLDLDEADEHARAHVVGGEDDDENSDADVDAVLFGNPQSVLGLQDEHAYSMAQHRRSRGSSAVGADEAVDDAGVSLDIGIAPRMAPPSVEQHVAAAALRRMSLSLSETDARELVDDHAAEPSLAISTPTRPPHRSRRGSVEVDDAGALQMSPNTIKTVEAAAAMVGLAQSAEHVPSASRRRGRAANALV